MYTIIDGNKVLETPIETILSALQQQIYASGINKLKHVNIHGRNASITCPIHKDGCENTPSCGILLEAKKTTKGWVPAGTVSCFTCGYRANITKFVADCLNISHRHAVEWLLSFTNYSFLSDIRDIGDINFEEVEEDTYKDLPIITSEDLKQYDYIHPYMFQRKLDDWLIDKFEVGYDPITDAITFPVYVNGRCLFVAKRRVKFKRFDMPEIYPKPIYGLDYLTDSEVYVCESIFNALTCWKYGKQAVALFGLGSDEQIEALNSIPQRKIVLALDGDSYGLKARERIRKRLTNKIVTLLETPTDGRDINDLSFEEFQNLEETF